jgi:hypothetical protein
MKLSQRSDSTTNEQGVHIMKTIYLETDKLANLAFLVAATGR